MPRLSAVRRLELMSAAVAYADDRQAQGVEVVPIDEIVEFLERRYPGSNDITEATVRDSLQPLEWVELTVPGGIVDLVGAIQLDEEVLRVEEGWWRRLGVLTPAEAARLYVKAAAAAAIDDDPPATLMSALRKLRRSVAGVTVVEGDEPYIVGELRDAHERREPVILHLEDHDRTFSPDQARSWVVAVFRRGDEWMTTIRSRPEEFTAPAGGDEAVTIPVDRVLDVIRAPGDAGDEDLSPAILDPEPSFTVTLEYPQHRDWVLDPFDRSEHALVGRDRVRSTVVIWGRPELETLMLRLGPDAEVIAPESTWRVGSEAAAKILAVYDEPWI